MNDDVNRELSVLNVLKRSAAWRWSLGAIQAYNVRNHPKIIRSLKGLY